MHVIQRAVISDSRFSFTFVILVSNRFTTAPPRHPHRNNDAILLPHPHRNNDAILLPLHIATTAPSYSTPTYSTQHHQARYNATSFTTHHNQRGRGSVSARCPAETAAICTRGHVGAIKVHHPHLPERPIPEMVGASSGGMISLAPCHAPL